MDNHEPEPWWVAQDADEAWIARQEAITAVRLAATVLPISASRPPAPCTGLLAEAIGKAFPLQVCQSAAGYYIGTLDEDGLPCSRESQEYWRKAEAAQLALERGQWTQKPEP